MEMNLDLHSNSNESALQVFEGYTSEKWADWITDLLYFNTAYPVFQFGLYDDKLVDVVHFLVRHKIDPTKYNHALADVFCHYVTTFKGNPFTERLLYATIMLRPLPAKFMILNFFMDPELDNVALSGGEPLKAKLLLGISKFQISAEEQERTLTYCKNVAWRSILANHFMLASYLRFIRMRFPLIEFFIEMDSIVLGLDRIFSIHSSKRQHLVTLIDLLEEACYDQKAEFYSTMLTWLTNIVENDQSLKHLQPLINGLAKDIDHMFNTNDFPGATKAFLGQIEVIRGFLLLHSSEINAKNTIGANELLSTVSYFLHKGARVFIYGLLLSNQTYLFRRISIFRNTISDSTAYRELEPGTEVYMILKALLNSPAQPAAPKLPIDKIMTDSKLKQSAKKAVHESNASKYQELLKFDLN